ncbi:MAG: phage major capsid protein [Clostridiales bacterium]|nr:phage major capsid protein [Clostridiales bacterium]
MAAKKATDEITIPEYNIYVEITFTEELLGTANADADIHEEFIAKKAPDAIKREEEIAALGVDEVVKKEMTVFPKENSVPFMWDYQWKGYFKDNASALKRIPGTESNSNKDVRAFKKIIDKNIYPFPRKIFIDTHGQPLGSCQRSLRGQTAQGEITALANSETVPVGSTVRFGIDCGDKKYEKWVKELLAYGKKSGTGQWRNSGKGRFIVRYLESLDEE